MGEHSLEENYKHFFNCVNLCQDCVVVKNKENSSECYYQGPSLDEICLLDMARDIFELGYFVERDSDSVRIKHPRDESMTEFKILKFNEFDSKRKCASVVVRAADGRIFAYVKGSDSSLMKMLNEGTKCKEKLEADIEHFAS